MSHSEGTFEGAGGRSIFYQYWRPESEPRAVLLVAHGAAEHSGRYAGFAAYFVSRGFAVAALDHPGHGRSEGARCRIDRFDDYLATLRLFHLRVAADFSPAPVFLVGHSMGGLISANYLLQHQGELAGCVLSGPAIKTALEPGALQLLLLRILSALAPGAGALQLDAGGVSRDPAVVEAYVNDPLVYHGKLPARLVTELFAGMRRVQQRAAEITLPLLLLHGEADSLTDPEGSRFLAVRAGSADKTLTIYPGLYHEIFNEPERETVLADVLAFCERRLTPTG